MRRDETRRDETRRDEPTKNKQKCTEIKLRGARSEKQRHEKEAQRRKLQHKSKDAQSTNPNPEIDDVLGIKDSLREGKGYRERISVKNEVSSFGLWKCA